jgi:McbB family protein
MNNLLYKARRHHAYSYGNGKFVISTMQGGYRFSDEKLFGVLLRIDALLERPASRFAIEEALSAASEAPGKLFDQLNKSCGLFQRARPYERVFKDVLFVDPTGRISEVVCASARPHMPTPLVCQNAHSLEVGDSSVIVAFFEEYRSSAISDLYNRCGSTSLVLTSYIFGRDLHLDAPHSPGANPCHFCRMLRIVDNVDVRGRRRGDRWFRHQRKMLEVESDKMMSLPISSAERGLVAFTIAKWLIETVGCFSERPDHEGGQRRCDE